MPWGIGDPRRRLGRLGEPTAIPFLLELHRALGQLPRAPSPGADGGAQRPHAQHQRQVQQQGEGLVGEQVLDRRGVGHDLAPQLGEEHDDARPTGRRPPPRASVDDCAVEGDGQGEHGDRCLDGVEDHPRRHEAEDAGQQGEKGCPPAGGQRDERGRQAGDHRRRSRRSVVLRRLGDVHGHVGGDEAAPSRTAARAASATSGWPRAHADAAATLLTALTVAKAVAGIISRKADRRSVVWQIRGSSGEKLRRSGEATSVSDSYADDGAPASHGDDDLAPGPAVLDMADGGRGLGQRVGPVDRRLHLPGLDEIAQRGQVRGVLGCHERAHPLAHQRGQQERPHAPVAPAQPAPTGLAADHTSLPLRVRARRRCDSRRLPPMSRMAS